MTPSVASKHVAGIGSFAGMHIPTNDIVLVTSSYDRTIKFWNPDALQSGMPFKEIQHADSVNFLEYLSVHRI